MSQFVLYTISLLVDALAAVSTKGALMKVIQNYLRDGAHPFFLQQGLWHMRWHLPEAAVEDAKRLLRTSSRRFKDVFAPGHGLAGPLERIYAAKDQPRVVHIGVVHGAFLEAYASLTQWFTLKQLPKNWEEEWDRLVVGFLQHPGADIALLNNIQHLESVFGEGLDRQGGSPKFDLLLEQHRKLFADFIVKRAADRGTRKVSEEILQLWKPKTIFRVFSLLYLWLSNIKSGSMAATEILRGVLAIRSGRSQCRDAARELFRYSLDLTRQQGEDPLDAAIVMQVVQLWVELLKVDLPQLDTFHGIVRWLQVAPEANRSMLVTLLAVGNGKIDRRAEALMESLTGPIFWKMVTVLAEPKSWKGDKIAADIATQLTSSITREEFLGIETTLKEMEYLLNRHNADLAEATDRVVHATGCSLNDAGEMWDTMMQLLAGDVVSVVSPLRQSWMKLERKPWEFLSSEFPLVQVAALPITSTPKGAECRFRLYPVSDPENPIAGSMDTEGKMRLDDIAVITPLARLALQAVVVQALAAVMVPRHIEQLAKTVGKGPTLLWEDEVFASRPVVHVVGELGKKQEDEGDGPIIDSVHRIHPMIAMLLFQWLLDQEKDWQPQLYRMFYDEMEGGKKEYFCAPWANAKELLKAGKVPLSEVFHNTVRAHTRPVPVYMDKAGSIIVRQVSERALRNYGRFLAYGGRKLDLRPVRKSFELPDGKLLRLDVARTFNQGTFNSLDQVWEMVPDLDLKAAARRSFKF